MSILMPHPTWSIRDNTKVQTWRECQRQYWYKHILGWHLDVESVHLGFGIAWHEAMAHLLWHGLRERGGGYRPEAREEAIAIFHKSFASEYPAEISDKEAKSPAHIKGALEAYCAQYAHDRFEVLDVEIAGTIDLTPSNAPAPSGTYILHFRMDSILRSEERGIFSLEHKTGSGVRAYWLDGFKVSSQISAYTYILQRLYPDERVWGVEVNSAHFLRPLISPLRKRKTLREGETLERRAKEIKRYEVGRQEFLRVPARRSPESLDAWLWEMQHTLEEIEMETTHRLPNTEEDEPAMRAFPRNETACTRYMRSCEFIPFCSLWGNPLSRVHNVQAGFRQRWWDPAARVLGGRRIIDIASDGTVTERVKEETDDDR